MNLELTLIKLKIEDIKEAINEVLDTKFKRGKESNRFYDKLETKFTKIKENYFEWNKNLIKQETEEELIRGSEKLQKKFRKSMKVLENFKKELKPQ